MKRVFFASFAGYNYKLKTMLSQSLGADQGKNDKTLNVIENKRKK